MDGSVSASLTSSNVISIVANDLDYVFWIRINEGFNAGTIEHGSNARMNITSAVPVQGVFSLTGTPTAVITETTSYTFNVLTPGCALCNSQNGPRHFSRLKTQPTPLV